MTCPILLQIFCRHVSFSCFKVFSYGISGIKTKQKYQTEGQCDPSEQMGDMIVLSVGMHAAEEVVYTEESHEDRRKSQYGKQVEQPFLQGEFL